MKYVCYFFIGVPIVALLQLNQFTTKPISENNLF